MKKILIFTFFLVLTLSLTSYSLNLPQHWDALFTIIPSAIYSLENNFSPFSPFNLGHPPFLAVSLSFLYYLFGYSLLVTHLYIIFLAFWSVFFAYLISEHLTKNKYIGITTALLFLFSPIFVGQSGIVTLATPFTTFSLMSIYFFLRNKYILFLIMSFLLSYTVESGVVLLMGLLFLPILKEFNNLNLKRVTLYSLPFMFYLSWLALSKFHWGWFFNPYQVGEVLSLNPFRNMLHLFFGLRVLFLDDFRWVLTSIIFLSTIYTKKNSKILYPFIFSVLLYLLLSNLNLFFPQLNDSLSNLMIELKNFSILFSILFFIFLNYRKRFYKYYIKSNLSFIIPIIIFVIAFHAFIVVHPRYLLPLYPLFYIFSGIALFKIFKNYTFIPLIVILALFISNWTGESDSTGVILEYNKEYVDMLYTHQQATKFIEENYPNANVMVSGFPQHLELLNPYGGYVKNPIKVEQFDREKLKKKEGIDLFYYSPQSTLNRDFPHQAEEFNLILLKKFERNNKTAYIFKV